MSKKGKVSKDDFLGLLDDQEEQANSFFGPSENTETRNKELIKNELSANKPVMAFEEKPVTEIETRNKEITEKPKTRNAKVIKNELSTNKPVMAPAILSLDKVSTYQREILHVIFTEVQSNPFEKETRPLNIQQLGELLGLVDSKAFESLRIVILRLEKDGFLIKTMVKTGRSGWTKYTLPSIVFDQILKHSKFEKPVIKSELSTNKELTKPVISDLSKKESNLNNILSYLTIPPSLLRIGLKEAHLERVERNPEDVQSILDHFAWSVDNNEIKSPHKLPVLLSVLKENKEWVSEGYLKELRNELELASKRSQELKELKLLQMKNKFQEFMASNPEFLNQVAQKNPLVKNPDVLENLAFQDFLSSNGN